MKSEIIGRTDNNEDIHSYTLENSSGMKVKLSDFGANLMELWVPDKNEVLANIVLGYDSLGALSELNCFFGAVVAPHANRIGKASFTLDGKTYDLEKNDGNNNLHSGSIGLQKKIWKIQPDEAENCVTFSISTADGEFGFPGNRQFSIKYSLTEDHRLILDYSAVTDAVSPFNPTNHTYFNLSGIPGSDILDHIITINAKSFTWADKESIPDGTLTDVKGTPMDFRDPHRIGERIEDDYEPLKWAGGYDHNWVLDHKHGELSKAATVFDPGSGRKMDVYTDLPGLQFYTGNYIPDGMKGINGASYPRRAGLCLETQYFPNALNVPAFIQPLVYPDAPAKTRTIYAFSAE